MGGKSVRSEGHFRTKAGFSRCFVDWILFGLERRFRREKRYGGQNKLRVSKDVASDQTIARANMVECAGKTSRAVESLIRTSNCTSLSKTIEHVNPSPASESLQPSNLPFRPIPFDVPPFLDPNNDRPLLLPHLFQGVAHDSCLDIDPLLLELGHFLADSCFDLEK